MQKNKPSDYVISTGKQYSVRQFVNLVLKELKISNYWKGKGLNNKCYIKNSNKCIIETDKSYFRPLEVDTLLGDSSKAKRELNWKPKTNIQKLVKEMVELEIADLHNVSKKF